MNPLAALKTDAAFRDQPLPSRAQIARLLKQAGLTHRYQPHHELIQPPRASLTNPHQEWQMDAQGIMQVEGVGKVSLISIVDVVSRLKAESYPSLETTNPALPDYQLTYRYYLGKHFAHRSVAMGFDPDAMVLICQPEGCEDTIQVPIQGITKAELMGELAVLQALPMYQLALPFSLAAWRQLEYAHNLIGTTL